MMKFNIILASLHYISAMNLPQQDKFESFNGYQIIEYLGHGAFGAVHEAQNIKTGSKVALKQPIIPDGVTLREVGIMKVLILSNNLNRSCKTAQTSSLLSTIFWDLRPRVMMTSLHLF
jgi:serine/threonine protein kinase